MKVLFAGNGTNIPYLCAKRLRERDHETELVFLERHITEHPLWTEVDTDLSELSHDDENDRYEWSEDHLRQLPTWVTSKTIDSDGDPRKRPSTHWKMIRSLRGRDCDVIHAYNIYNAIWAYFTGKPYVYHITGHYDWQRDRHVSGTQFKLPLYVLVRLATKNADRVVGLGKWLRDFKSRYDSVEVTELPQAYNADLFYSSPERRSDADELQLFAGARHDWNTKRTDVMLEGIAQLDDIDFHLTTIEWGRDVDRTRRLVAELGLEDSVTFAPLMSKPRLARTIRHSDAVLDQFRFGFGSLARQTLACGTPLISEVDPSRWEQPPPILRASTPDEVTERIRSLNTEGDRVRQESVEWMNSYYNQESIIDRYAELYADILGR